VVRFNMHLRPHSWEKYVVAWGFDWDRRTVPRAVCLRFRAVAKAMTTLTPKPQPDSMIGSQ